MVKNDATYLSTLNQLSAMQNNLISQKKNRIPQFQAEKNCTYEACTTLSYVRKIAQVRNFQQQLQKQQNIIAFVITTKILNVNGD